MAVTESELDPAINAHTGYHRTVCVCRPQTVELRFGGATNRDIVPVLSAAVHDAVSYAKHFLGMPNYMQFESIAIVHSKFQRTDVNGIPVVDKAGQVQTL